MEFSSEHSKLLIDLISLLGSNLTLIFFFLILSVIPWISVFYFSIKLNKLAIEIEKAIMIQANALREIREILALEIKHCKEGA